VFHSKPTLQIFVASRFLPFHGGVPSQQPLPAPPQQVFAYLPLRSYGFKFLINADWIVPSSREDITRRCPRGDT